MEQLIELLKQIQELAGAGVKALSQAGGKEGGEPEGERRPPEGGERPEGERPPGPPEGEGPPRQ